MSRAQRTNPIAPEPGGRNPPATVVCTDDRITGRVRRVKAIILAAGDGGRLGSHTEHLPKPLVPLDGVPLINYTLDALRSAGAGQAAVVLGYRAAQLRAALEQDPRGVRLSFVTNPEFRGGQSRSLRAAREFASGGPSLLVMADHVLSPGIIHHLLDAWQEGGPTLVAVDSSAWPAAYVEEATRVAVEAGSRLVTAIGKQVTPWDGLDTGAFLLAPDAWDALDAAPADCELSEILGRLAASSRLAAVDVTGCFWYDVDTAEDLAAASAMLAAGRAG